MRLKMKASKLKPYLGFNKAKHKLSPAEIGKIIQELEDNGEEVEEGFYKDVENGR